MSRDDAWVLDILLAARKIQRVSQGITRERFLADELKRYRTPISG